MSEKWCLVAIAGTYLKIGFEIGQNGAGRVRQRWRDRSKFCPEKTPLGRRNRKNRFGFGFGENDVKKVGQSYGTKAGDGSFRNRAKIGESWGGGR